MTDDAPTPAAIDRQGRTIAQRTLDIGAAFPYDAPNAWWRAQEANPPPRSEDWAHLAARGVVADLLDRRAIKNAFDDIAEDVRADMIKMLAEIIRLAPSHKVQPL